MSLAYTDFEDDLLNLKQAGAKVSHMNYSTKFPAVFWRYVYSVVKTGPSKELLRDKLTQTGHRPRLPISADKATSTNIVHDGC